MGYTMKLQSMILATVLIWLLAFIMIIEKVDGKYIGLFVYLSFVILMFISVLTEKHPQPFSFIENKEI